MRKIFLLVALVAGYCQLHAQSTPTTDSLVTYTGKYKFPDGSVVTETVVSLKDGILSATSDMGDTELKKIEGDVFEVVAYSGTATFKRNPEGKVIGVHIEVGDVILEGTKVESLAIVYRMRANFLSTR